MCYVIVVLVLVVIVLISIIVVQCQHKTNQPTEKRCVPSYNLEKRIADLESPFRFKVGDKVSGLYYGYGRMERIDGVITSAIFEYDRHHYRINKYTVYDDKNKRSKTIVESELSILKGK